jgi:hypothetical protein
MTSRLRSASAASTVLALAASLSFGGCGARTELHGYQGQDAAAPECVYPLDCPGAEDLCHPIGCVEGKCVPKAPLDCDDLNPCTVDGCEPDHGRCTHDFRTLDNDGDGHRGPLSGHKAGDPGSCGDDCDDTSSRAYPGNKEICDGVDNDCNGVVDDGARYLPYTTDPDAVRVSADDLAPIYPGGLAYANGSYFATLTGAVATKSRVFTASLDENGNKRAPEAQLTKVVADAFGGRVVWTGDGFGVTWEDRRTGSWEVYFSRLDRDGNKLAADVLVSEDDSFWSYYDALAWTGSEFVVVWEGWPAFNRMTIRGRRLDAKGAPIGPDVELVNDEVRSESPTIAVGRSGLGMVWNRMNVDHHEVYFQTFDRTFAPVSAPVRVTSDTIGGSYPTLVWNDDRYVVAWADPDGTPHAIYAASFDEQANVVTKTTKVTDSPRWSRFPALLPMGDRLEMIFSDTKDQNSGYELYVKQLSRELTTIGDERRITRAIGDSIAPMASFGPVGEAGVLFSDYRLDVPHVYFTRLACTAISH